MASASWRRAKCFTTRSELMILTLTTQLRPNSATPVSDSALPVCSLWSIHLEASASASSMRDTPAGEWSVIMKSKTTNTTTPFVEDEDEANIEEEFRYRPER